MKIRFFNCTLYMIFQHFVLIENAIRQKLNNTIQIKIDKEHEQTA